MRVCGGVCTPSVVCEGVCVCMCIGCVCVWGGAHLVCVMCRGSVHVGGVGVCAHRVLCVGGVCVRVYRGVYVGGARRVCVVCRRVCM